MNDRKSLQEKILLNQTSLKALNEERIVLEQALNTSAMLYRQQHVERKQLMATWRDAVGTLNSRDKAIRDTAKVWKTKR